MDHSAPTTTAPSSSSAVDIEKHAAGSSKAETEGSTEFRIPSRCNSAQKQEIVDAVWGVQEEGSPNYRALGWIRTGILLTKTQIGLGVLGLASMFNTVGIVPGVILLLVFAVLSTWSAWIISEFKERYPSCHSVADVGELWWGPIGREALGLIYWLMMTFIAGSAFLSFSIALNAISLHATCTQVYVVVGVVVCSAFASIQTLHKVSYIGWVGLVSIVGSVIVLAIAVGVQDRPSAAPQVGPWEKNLVLFGNPSFADAANSLGTLVFAYCGTPAFFNVIAEMKEPKDFHKSVILAQSLTTAVYVSLSIVVYYYCGQYVASPALGSAGPLLKRICYGVALPGLIVSALLYTHLPAKYVFVRVLRGSHHLSHNTKTHWAAWLGCVGGCALFSYIVASAIPFFGDLISLIGSLFGTGLVFIVEPGMWLYMRWHMVREPATRNRWFYWGAAFQVFMILSGFFITVSGTYGAVLSINTAFKTGATTSPWSCADNSAST